MIEKDLLGSEKISEEHIENNKAVREILGKRGVKPELLLPSDDINKVKRRLKSDEKKVLRGEKRIRGKKYE